MSYDADFYEMVKKEALPSARVVVPLVVEAFAPKSVVDVGCGQGVWTAEFKAAGCSVMGVDGDYVSIPHLEIDPSEFHAMDLNHPVDLGTHDLAVSLEVAEHLEPSRARGFVEDLCRAAPVVLFSAAFPGQGGIGHVNEQPIGYWVDLFSAQSRIVSGALRWMVWDDPEVAPYYKSNLLVAVQPVLATQFRSVFDQATTKPWGVVHPDTFRHVTGR